MQYMSLCLPYWQAIKLSISTSVLKHQNLTHMQTHATLVRMVKAEANPMETLSSFKAQHAFFLSFYCMQEVNYFLLSCLYLALPMQQKHIGTTDKFDRNSDRTDINIWAGVLELILNISGTQLYCKVADKTD